MSLLNEEQAAVERPFFSEEAAELIDESTPTAATESATTGALSTEDDLLRLLHNDPDGIARAMAAVMAHQGSAGAVTPSSSTRATLRRDGDGDGDVTATTPARQVQGGLVGILAREQHEGSTTPTASSTPRHRGRGITFLDPTEAQQLQAGLVNSLARAQGSTGATSAPAPAAGQAGQRPSSASAGQGTQPLPPKVSPKPTLVAAIKEMVREQSNEKSLLADMKHQGK